jgi:GT2 family glycosyltransferase
VIHGATTGATSAAPSPGAAAGRVTAVLTLFNSGKVVGAAPASLPAARRVVVVDNASRDGGAAVARAARPDAELVALPRNEGFGRGCNAGLERVGTEFAALVNPDLTVSPDALDLCVAAADAEPRAAILGGDEGGAAAPRGAFVPAPVVSGSFMPLRMAALREIDGFDPTIFPYFEDDDLCLRARAAGWRVGRVAGARVAHARGGSTAPALDSDDEKSRLWALACACFADKRADRPEGRRARRKLASYRLKALLSRFGASRGARRYRALARGAADYRRGGAEAMFRNAFAGPHPAGGPS